MTIRTCGRVAVALLVVVGCRSREAERGAPASARQAVEAEPAGLGPLESMPGGGAPTVLRGPEPASLPRPDPTLTRAVGKPIVGRDDVVAFVRAQNARAGDRSQLVLREFTFDPASGPPVFRKPSLGRSGKAPAPGSRQKWIVQLDRSPTVADRDAIARVAPILRYLPNNAYLVEADASAHGALLGGRTGAPIRAMLPFHPGLKFDPRLTARLDGSTLDLGPLLVEVQLFSPADLQRVAAEIDGLGAPDVRVVHAADERTFGAIYVQLGSPVALPDLTDRLSELEEVEALNLFEVPTILNDSSMWLIQSGDVDSHASPVWSHGIVGTGQRVTVADTGLDVDHCAFRYGATSTAATAYNSTKPPTVNVTNPGNKVVTAYGIFDGGDSEDCSFHGTHVAGSVAGDNYATRSTPTSPGHDPGDGMAPGATLVVQDIGGASMWGGCGLNPGSMTDLLHQSYDSGSRLHTNSWGSGGTAYSSIAYSVDQVIWEKNDYLVLFAAGNDGPRIATINTHATHKDGIAVGAASHGSSGSLDVTSFSSHGPTADGRFKPDVTAPGETIVSALGTATTTDANCSTVGMSGTSMATPTTAGGAALVRQYVADGFYPTGARRTADQRTPSGALVKALLINSARNMPGKYTATDGVAGASAPIPTSGQGWGRITLDDALYFAGDARGLTVLKDAWNGSTDAIQAGQTHLYTVPSVSCSQALKITLTWSDPPGATASGLQLVNDLDLRVTAPDGNVYRGNQLEGGWSKAGDGADRLNTVENVFVRYPKAGSYTVEVVGARVPGKGTTVPFDDTKQGYALVATGDFSGSQAPVLAYESHRVHAGCDDDPYLDRGERVDLDLTIRNAGCTASGAATRVSLAVDPLSEIPASAVTLSTPATYGAIAGDGTATRTLGVTLSPTATGVSGKSVTLIATMEDPDAHLTTTKQIRVPVGLDEVDAFVDRIEEDVDLGWVIRPSDSAYTLDTRPWLKVPGVFGAPSPTVLSDASGPGAYELRNIHSGWMSPMIPIGTAETMSSIEFWRYVDFGSSTGGTSQVLVYYFDRPDGVVNGDGMTGYTIGAAYTPGMSDERRWVHEQVRLGPQPPGTTHFRVVLMLRLLDGPADGVYYDDLRVRKTVADAKAPCSETCAVPPSFGGVQAARATCSAIELSWAQATPGCGGAVHYQVYRDTSPDFANPTRLTGCALTDTRFVDTGITPGITYYYRVHAEDYASGAGPCGGNLDGNAAQLAASPTGGAPQFAGITSANGTGTCNVVNLAWSPAAPMCPGASVRYNVYRSTTAGELGERISACGAVSGVTYSDDTGLTPGTTYHYTVKAVDSADASCAVGTESASSTQTAVAPTDTTPPVVAAPATVEYASCGGAVKVTWPAATDSCTGVADYVVYRSTTLGALGTPVGIATGTTLTDSTSPGSSFHYTVHARDRAANESTNAAQATTSMAPRFDGLLTVNPGASCGSIELYWNRATPGCPGSNVRYHVYRSASAGFTPSDTNRITTCATAPTGTSFVDPNVGGGVSYHYIVRAEDTATGGAGACGGYEDANKREISSYAEAAIFSDDFESGLDASKWDATPGYGTSTAAAHGGTTSVWSGNAAGACDSLATKFLDLPREGVSLTFWASFAIDENRDRGVIEVSTDGATWTRVVPVGGYPGATVNGNACIGGVTVAAFTGSSAGAWRPYRVDLTPWAGRQLKIRFLFGTDATSITPGGWYIDDVAVTSAGTCFDCARPPVFAGLKSATTGPSCGTATLTWEAAVQGCSGKLVHYNVYRSTTPSELGSLVTSCATPISATSYQDTGLEPGTTYFYTVRAEDGSTGHAGPCGGNTELNDNQLAAAYADTVAPTFGGVASAATECRSGRVNVSWAGATDACSGVKDYLVFRSDTDTAIGDQIATVAVAYAPDVSGSGNEAELRGTRKVAGHQGDGRELRGSDVAIVNPSGVPLGAAWEIEAWFKYPFDNGNVSSWHALTRSGGSCGDIQIAVYTDQVSLGGYDDCGKTGWRDSGYDLGGLSPGWHHVRAVGEGSTTTYYVDGAPVGAVPWKSTSSVYTVGGAPGSSWPFGSIDDVRVSVAGQLRASFDFEGIADASTSYADAPPAPGTYYYTVWARDRGGKTAYAMVQKSASATPGLSFSGATGADGTSLCSQVKVSWSRAASACGAAGGAVADASPAGNAGVLTGTTPAAGRDGVPRTALSFTGDDHVRVEDAPGLNAAGGITVEAWLNPASDTSSARYVVAKGETYSSPQYYLAEVSGSHQIEVGVYVAGAWRYCRTSASDVAPPGAWTHVAATYDGTTELVYLNGVERCRYAFPGAVAAGASPLYVGALKPDSYGFRGLLDEVRVYPYARSASQIASDAATTEANDLQTAAASYSFSNEGGLNYNVYRAESVNGPWARVSGCGLSGAAFTDSGLVRERTYQYKVQVEDSAVVGDSPCGGVETPSDVVVAAAPTDTSAPTSFYYFNATATPNCVAGGVDLSWPTANDCSMDQLTYRVYRSTEKSVIGDPILQTTPPRSTIARDGSPNGNHGTIIGAWPAAGRDGGAASALRFWNGSFVKVPSADGLNASTALSLEALVYPMAYVSGGTFLRKSYDLGGADQYYLGNYSSTGRIELGLVIAGAWHTCLTPAGSETPLRAWSHVAGTYDGATMRVYLDGVEKAACPQTGAVAVGDRALYVGSHPYGAQFDGVIDEARVYPYARTAVQVAADAASVASQDLATAAASFSFDGEGLSPRAVTDASAVPGQTYYYSVLADDGEGYRYGGGFGELTLACTPASACATAPAFAGVTSASSTLDSTCGENAVTVRWGAAAPTCHGYATHYNVYRSSVAGQLGTRISGCNVTGDTFVDTSAPPGTWYYTVRAEDAFTGLAGACGGHEDGNLVQRAAEVTGDPRQDLRPDTMTFAGLDSAAGGGCDAQPRLSWSAPIEEAGGVQHVDCTPRALASWSFDGAAATDESGNANHGTLGSAVVASDGGHAGKALTFNGTASSFAKIPGSESLGGGQSLSVEAWVRPTAYVAYHGRFVDRARHYRLMNYSNTGRVTFGVYVVDRWRECTTASGDAAATTPLATWTSVRGSYDGNTVRVAVNGVEKCACAVGSCSQSYGGVAATGAEPLYLGAYNETGTDGHFNGMLDDVRITEDSRIVPLLAASDAARGLDLSLPFDDATATDRSGKGNHGVVGPKVVTGAAGRSGAAFQFSAQAGSYVRVGSNSSLSAAGGLTVEAWVSPSAASAYEETLVSKSFGGSPEYLLRLPAYSKQVLFQAWVDGAWRSCTTSEALPVGTFTALTASYDGVMGRVLFNGVEKCRFAYTGQIVAGSAPVYVGSEDGAAKTFDGVIDELRIFGEGLPASGKYTSSIAYFPFDVDGDDRTPLASDAALVGGARVGVGYVGGGLELDGVDDRAAAANSPERNPGARSFTAEAWVKTTAASGAILSKGAAAGFTLSLMAGAPSAVLSDGADVVSAVATRAVNDGAWHHVAAVFDRAAGAGLRIYVDGEAAVPAPPSLAALGSADSADALTIGATSGPAPGAFLAGSIDEVRLSPYVRLDSELRAAADLESRVGEWHVYRSTTQGGLGERIATLPRRQLRHVDPAALAPGTYHYAVRLADRTGVEDTNIVQRAVAIASAGPSFAGIAGVSSGTCADVTVSFSPARSCSSRIGGTEAGIRRLADGTSTIVSTLNAEAQIASDRTYEGVLRIDAPGTYTFRCDKYLYSGCGLWIDGAPVAMTQNGSYSEGSATLATAGDHPLRFQYTRYAYSSAPFTLQWACPGCAPAIALQAIPAANQLHVVDHRDLVRYHVYRSSTAGALGTPLGTCLTASASTLTVKAPGPGVGLYAVVAEDVSASGPDACGGVAAPNTVQLAAAATDAEAGASFGGISSITNACDASNAITVSWSAWADTCSATQAYRVYRADDASAQGRVIATVAAPATSYTDTTGTPGKTYYYKVVAVDAFGNLNSSASARAVEAATGQLPPSFAGVNSASSQNTCNKTALSWYAATPRCTGDAITYRVLRGESAQGPFAEIASGVTSTGWTSPSNLSTGATYFWRVQALADGVADGNTRTVSSQVTDTAVPAFSGLTSLTTSCSGAGGNTLKWSAGSDTCSSVAYDVYRATEPGALGAVIATLPAGATSYTDASAATGTSYSYAVLARDGSGNTSGSINQLTIATADATPIFAGARVVVPAPVCTAATVSWLPGTSACGDRALHYNVYRSGAAGALGSLLVPAANHVLRSQGGISGGVTNESFRRSTATLRSGDSVSFDVQPSSDYPDFRVYLLTPDQQNGLGVVFGNKQINARYFRGSTTGTDTPALVASMKAGVWYHVVLRADDFAGFSVEVGERDSIQSLAKYVLEGLPAGRLDWGFYAFANTTKADVYLEDFREVTAAGTLSDDFETLQATAWSLGAHQSIPYLLQLTGTSFTDGRALLGSTWYYTVRAEDDSTGGAGPAGGVEDRNLHQVSFTPADFDPPTFAGITSGAQVCDGADAVNLAFGAATDACSGVAGYTVYRSTTPGALGEPLGTVEAAGYQDATVVPGATYYYTVRARDRVGNEDANLTQLALVAGETPPTFAGVERVVARGCAENVVSFAPAASNCEGRRLHYNVYRSTQPGFTPGPETLITSCQAPVDATAQGGLLGEYFDNGDFTALRQTRLDPTIDLSWGTGQPGPGIGADDFSIRWTGELRVDIAGEYTLYLNADDGVRLDLDGARLFDAWAASALSERRRQIMLTPGKHPIRLEYMDKTGAAEVHLSWSCAECTPAIPAQVVPAQNLYGPTHSYVDSVPVPGKPNYYVVRADDGPLAVEGTCVTNEDPNLAAKGVEVLGGLVGPGPVAAYSFDAGTADDTSGHLPATQGTIYGATFAAGAGRNGAMEFVGAESDRIEIPLRLPETDETVRFWFRTTGAGGFLEQMDGALGSATPGANYDRTVYLTSASPAGRVCQRVSNNETICSATGNYDDGQWHEYALTIERGAGQRMFIDGAEVARGTRDHSDLLSGTRLWLGYSHDAPVSYLTGTLDEVAILDYVELQGAALCPAPPGEPALELAEACGTTANAVNLAWSVVDGANSYEIHRSRASCDAPSSFTALTKTSGTSFTDGDVSGGDPAVAYAYKVRAYSSATGMYGDFSNCVSCSPSGVCTLAPRFAGAASAGSSHLASCASDVSWDPGTSSCAREAGDAVTYSVYRGTSPDFTPSAFNRIAKCLTGTSYHDEGPLVAGTTYHYLVRAEDATTAQKPGAGGCNGGNEDDNEVRRATRTEGLYRIATFSDDAGDATPAQLAPKGYGWGIAWFDNHTPGGNAAYFVPGAASQCNALVTPELDLRAADEFMGSPTTLSFWVNAFTGPGDGVVLEVAHAPALDDWAPLGAAADYPSALAGGNACGLPAGTPAEGNAGTSGWSGWHRKVFSLAAYEGSTVVIRFRFATGALGRVDGGALVDDVEVTNAWVPVACLGAPPAAPCLGAPSFAGVGQALGTTAGSIDVSWGEAASSCPDASIRYNVYRATAAPFVPDATHRVASCLTGTTFTDSPVDANVVYSYVVRSEDVSHSGTGPCGGLEDGNVAILSASATAPKTVSTYDGFEGGLDASRWTWTSNWSATSSDGRSGGGAAHLAPVPGACDELTMKVGRALAPGVNTYATMWARFETEPLFDGGFVELTTDGSTWTRIAPEGGYSATLVRSSLACTVPEFTEVPGLTGSTGGTYRKYTFNLFPWNGKTVRLRLRWGSDASGMPAGAGVWVDDFAFEQERCTPTGIDSTCNRRDDDCNGGVDDAYQGATCGVGACRRHATCTDGVETSCTPGPKLASDDRTCDGVDDDCDGLVDEDCDACCCGPMTDGRCTTTQTCGWVSVDPRDSSCGGTVRQCWKYSATSAAQASAASTCDALRTPASAAAHLPTSSELQSITTSSRYFSGSAYASQYLWTSTLSGSKPVKQQIGSVSASCGTSTCSSGTCVAGAQSTTNASVPFGCLAPYPAFCGDTRCDLTETAATCPIDCAPTCGDGMCNGTESCDGSSPGTTACAADCRGSCPTMATASALYNPFTRNYQDTYMPASGYWSPGGSITHVHVNQATENGYDFCSVYDAAGNQIWRQSGTRQEWVALPAPTTGIRTRLVTDSVVQSGFGCDVDLLAIECATSPQQSCCGNGTCERPAEDHTVCPKDCR